MAAWIEMIKHVPDRCIFYVASRVGAWIEMQNTS